MTYELTTDQINKLNKFVSDRIQATFPKEWLPTEKEIQYAKENAYAFKRAGILFHYKYESAVCSGLKRTKDFNLRMRKAAALLMHATYYICKMWSIMNWSPSTECNNLRAQGEAIYDKLVDEKNKMLRKFYEVNNNSIEDKFKNSEFADIDDIQNKKKILFKKYSSDTPKEGTIDASIKINIGNGAIAFNIPLDKLPDNIIVQFKDKILKELKELNIRKA